MPEESRIKRIIPEIASNMYKGHPIAYYFFIFLTLLTVGRSLIHIFAPDGGAQSIASINLNIQGGEIIVGMFVYWGLSQLILGIIFLIVLVRYNNLIPLMYVFTLIEYSSRFLLVQWKPIETEMLAPGAVGNWILPFFAILMLVLSLSEWNPNKNT